MTDHSDALGRCDYVPPKGFNHGPTKHFWDPVCINWRPLPQPTPPEPTKGITMNRRASDPMHPGGAVEDAPTVRVAWEKAWVKIRVPVEGTTKGAWEETEIPLAVLFPTDVEFRAAVKRLNNDVS